MGDGWGSYGTPSTWRTNHHFQQSFWQAPPSERRLRTAQDFFKQWEQDDIDKGLVVYTDYKLDLDKVLRLLAHQEDKDEKLEHILDPLDLREFRLIQHLTPSQIKRVHYLATKS